MSLISEAMEQGVRFPRVQSEPTVQRTWDALALEITRTAVPTLRMVDTLQCVQDPDDQSRVIPVLLIRPSGPVKLHDEADQRLANCLRFVVQDATMPAVNPFHTVRLLIYPRQPYRLVPMWMSAPGTGRVNCSCGLPWSWCHVVGPHHHTLRSRDFEEAWTATGCPTEVR